MRKKKRFGDRRLEAQRGVRKERGEKDRGRRGRIS
jgi:hypothetical protein